MLRLFKTYNPYSVLILFLLTIVLKLNYLANPYMPLTDSNDSGGIWQYMVTGMVLVFGKSPFFYTFTAVINSFLQAIYINRLASKFDIFTKQNYLPGLTFILVGSLIPDWNYLSQHQLLNWFLIALLFNIFNMYQVQDANKYIFNSGIIISLIFLFTTAGFSFIILFLAALNILRPFRLREWTLFGIGFTLLIYFYSAYLFLADRLSNIGDMFSIGFYFSAEYNSLTVFLVGMGFVLLALIWGIIYLNNFMGRMVIKSKKYWSITIIFLVTTLVAVLFSEIKDSLSNWLLLVPSAALIATNGFYETRFRWLSSVFFYALTGGSLLVQWVLV